MEQSAIGIWIRKKLGIDYTDQQRTVVVLGFANEAKIDLPEYLIYFIIIIQELFCIVYCAIVCVVNQDTKFSTKINPLLLSRWWFPTCCHLALEKILSPHYHRPCCKCHKVVR